MKSGPTILDAEPQLFVSDLTHALDFFVEMLGFAIAFTHGEPAFYAQVVRGGARINLRHLAGPVFAPDLRAREADPLAVTLTVAGIEALFDEYRRRGVPFHQELRTEPWGVRTFIVHGPDANLLAFAGRK